MKGGGRGGEESKTLAREIKEERLDSGSWRGSNKSGIPSKERREEWPGTVCSLFFTRLCDPMHIWPLDIPSLLSSVFIIGIYYPPYRDWNTLPDSLELYGHNTHTPTRTITHLNVSRWDRHTWAQSLLHICQPTSAPSVTVLLKKENPGINNGNKSRPLIDRQRETIWKWKITRDTLGETERKRIWSAKVKVAWFDFVS